MPPVPPVTKWVEAVWMAETIRKRAVADRASGEHAVPTSPISKLLAGLTRTTTFAAARAWVLGSSIFHCKHGNVAPLGHAKRERGRASAI